ncbi:MAG TPA: C40 family peptidase [Saprospiraceae bacterium]|nr:C40 family peptidase [Saprospiraceae bacterium]HPI08886.1 C40 family peptidase [Saprospiraceae bacterium]
MITTDPSSRLQDLVSRAFLPILLFVVIACSSFKSVGRRPSDRAEDVEAMQLRCDITGYAQNFLGLRYRYAGVTPKTGFDCSGFTSYILREFNLKVSSCSSTQSRQGNRISLDEVLPGDLVFFGRRGRIQHVAMVVEKTAEGIMCVHSTCSRGIIVENISTSKYWKPKILFARDIISGQTAG